MNILITGASGLIGKSLTELLLKQGHSVAHLSRSRKPVHDGVRVFLWDVEQNTIDPDCLQGIDTVVHLAGENIAAKPWSNHRKEAILKSRTDSIRMIYRLAATTENVLSSVISASAVGYYGDRGEEWLKESAPSGDDFLGKTCAAWEKAVDEAPIAARVVKLRTGIVLDKNDGALVPMARAIQLGLGAPLGSGKQWMSWIHIDDAVAMYAFAIENVAMAGAFNMVAPEPVVNREFTKRLARELKKPLWLPRVPAWALRLLLGKMSLVVTISQRASSKKIEQAGYRFRFRDLSSALAHLYDEF